MNQIRYHGVFAPASPLRRFIVLKYQDKKMSAPPRSRVVPSSLDYTWASLMKRVFALDVLECPKCKSRMQRIAFIRDKYSIMKFLKCVGLFGNSPPNG